MYIWVKLFAAYIIMIGSNSKSKILLFGYLDSGMNFSFPEIQRLMKSNFASQWSSSMNFCHHQATYLHTNLQQKIIWVYIHPFQVL